MASGLTSKEYTLAIKIAGAVSSSFDSALGQASKKLTDLGSIAKAAAATAAAAWGALKIGEFISGAVDTYQGFEQAMANTSAIAGATGAEYDALRQAALDMGKATSKSAQECADALGYMSLAGWDVNTSIASLEPILRLSEATGLDLARCSDLVTDSMSALGLEAKDLAGYLDIAAAANNKSNQTAEMLMEAYIGVGGTMKGLNVPVQESAAALGVLANRGIKGSEAGNALNAVLVNLTTGSGQAGKMMAKLGISAFDSNGKFIGLEQIIRKVSDATSGMTEEQRNAALAAIGGKQHIDALNALMSGLNTTTADGVSEWAALSDALYNSEGAMADMAAAVTNTWDGAKKRLDSAIDDLKINLVSTFAPYATEALNTVAAHIPAVTEAITTTAKAVVEYAIPKLVAFKDGAIQAFNEVRPTLERIGTAGKQAFLFLADTARTAMQGVGEVVAKHSGLFEKLGQIAANVGRIIGDIWERLKPVLSYAAENGLPKVADAILTIVEKLADLALLITENKALVIALVSAFAAFKGITAISEFGNKVTKVAASVEKLQAVTKGTSLATSLLSGKLTGAQSAFSLLTGKIKLSELAAEGFKTKLGSFTGGFSAIGNVAKTAFTGLKSGIASVGAKLAGLGGKITAFIAANPALAVIAIIGLVIAAVVVLYNKCEWFRDKVNAIIEAVKGYLQTFLEKARAIFQQVRAVVQDVWAQVQPYLQAAWNTIITAVTAVISFFQTNVLPGLLAVWDSIKGAFAAAWEFIKAVWEAAKPYFLAVWEAIKDIFAVVVEVLGGFFRAAWATIQVVWAAVSPFFSAIWEEIKAIFSVVGAVLGGFFKTAWEVIKAVWNSAAAYFQAIFDTIGGIFSAMTAVLHGDFSGAWEAIKGIFSSWGTFFQTVWDGIKGIFGAVKDWFSGVFTAAWNGVKAVFTAGIEAVKNSVSGFFSKLDEMTGGAVTRVAEFFSGLWEGIKGIWRGAADWFSNTVITPIVNFFSPILETIGGIFRGLWIIIQAVWVIVADWFNNTVITPLVNFFAPIVETVGGFFADLWDGIQAVWAAVSGWFQDTVITPLVGFFSAIPGAIGGFFSSLWATVQEIWTAAAGWFDSTVVQPLINFFAPIVEGIGGFFSSLWANITGIWQAAGAWFQENVTTPVNSAFQAVGDFVKGVFNGVIGFVESMINSVIGGINKFVGGFSGIVEKAASFLGVEWDGIAEVPTVSLPRLAKGGIATGPTIAQIGEGGEPEAVLPLSKLVELLESWAGALPQIIPGQTPAPLAQETKERMIASIPALATGGIATAPTIAQIGEGGEPEAVVPLSKLAGMMQGLADANKGDTPSAAAAQALTIQTINRTTLPPPPLPVPPIESVPQLPPSIEAAAEAAPQAGELWGQMRDQLADALSGATGRIAALAEQVEAEDAGVQTFPLDAILDALNGDDWPDDDAPPPPVNITYAPQNHYHFEGDAPSKEEIAGAERMSQEDFNRMIDQYFRDQQRRNFRG